MPRQLAAGHLRDGSPPLAPGGCLGGRTLVPTGGGDQNDGLRGACCQDVVAACCPRSRGRAGDGGGEILLTSWNLELLLGDVGVGRVSLTRMCLLMSLNWSLELRAAPGDRSIMAFPQPLEDLTWGSPQSEV